MADALAVQTSQQNFVTARLNDANAFINTLLALQGVNAVPVKGLPDPIYGNTVAGVDPIATRSFLALFRPAPFVGSFINAAQPELSVPDIIVPADIAVPDFNNAAPVLNIPVTPSTALPPVPSAPSLLDPAVPGSPTLTFPVAPTVSAVTLPTPPSVTVPGFDPELPVDDLLAPTVNFAFAEAAYQSALLDAAKAKLFDDLVNGGYGIDTNDEQLLWDRARARELENANQADEQIVAEYAARGFPLPPGQMQIQLERNWRGHADKVSGLSRDIAIKRADLFVENRKFTITETRALEQVLISYYMSQMERALNAQRYSADIAISLFTALVARYNARLGAYQAQAVVFEAQVRAALAQVELYRTTMEGKRIEADLQRVAVEIYTAQLAGVNAIVNVYKTQMEAAQIAASIERTKLEAYRAQIDAFVAQVQAKSAEFGMYESQIRGQTARVTAYQAEVQAYVGTVQGAEAKARIAQTQVDAEAKAATIALESYKAQVGKYSVDLDTQIKILDANIRTYGAQIQGYVADTSAITASYTISQAATALDYNTQIKQAEIAVKNAELTYAGLAKAYDVKLGAANSASNYYAALIGSANAAITSIAGHFETASVAA